MNDHDALIDTLIAERSRARANRDFVRADEIRAAFDAAGIEVQDTPGGPSKWLLKDGCDLSKLDALR